MQNKQTKSMNKVINQHLVPKSYLRSFSQNDQIFVYDKKEKKRFKTNINKIPVEKYFNDFPWEREGRVETQYIENRLAEFEDLQIKLFKHLTKKIRNMLSLQQKGKFYGKKIINPSQKEDPDICEAISRITLTR